MFVLGAIHLARGGNPFAVWREALRPVLSAYVSDFWARDEFTPLMRFSGWRVMLYPPMILGVIGVVWVGYWSYGEVVRMLQDKDAVVMLYLFGGMATSLLVLHVGGWLKGILRQRRQLTEREKAVGLLKTYAACGTERPVDAPVSFRLVLSGFKRRVCRSYSAA